MISTFTILSPLPLVSAGYKFNPLGVNSLNCDKVCLIWQRGDKVTLYWRVSRNIVTGHRGEPLPHREGRRGEKGGEGEGAQGTRELKKEVLIYLWRRVKNIFPSRDDLGLRAYIFLTTSLLKSIYCQSKLTSYGSVLMKLESNFVFN